METDTVMVFLSPSFPRNFPPSDTSFVTINQADLASTMSILMGTAIPNENVGVFIEPVLRAFLSDDAMRSSTCEMASQLHSQFMSKNLLIMIPEMLYQITEQHCGKSVDVKPNDPITAKEVLVLASEILAGSSSTYDLNKILTAVIVGAACIFLHVQTLISSNSSKWTVEEKFGLAFLIFHAASFGASSFVEEEHQLWYFWVPSFFLISLLHFTDGIRITVVGSVGGLLAVHRLAREWNRTGDKWAYLPDIGDWLRE